MSFWALATYVISQAAWDLAQHHAARHSIAGIGIAIAALVVMPALAISKARTGRRLGSAAVTADSKQSTLCATLSAVLLAGIIANTALGVVVGRPHGRHRHRLCRCQRGTPLLARRNLCD